MEFSKEESIQYQRHLSLPGFGMEAQAKLKSASVLLIGAGGLGCPALQYLTAAGIGKIGIVDDDLVEGSNLQRQVLYKHGDKGKLKAEVAARRLSKLNPHIEIIPYPERLSRHNAAGLFEGYDIIVDGTDSFDSRYLINDACVLFGKVLVYGAIHKFEGQLSVFNHRGGPTYRCLFPHPPAVDSVPNCSDLGVIGVLPGIIGSMQALEAIKVITGVGEPLSGKLLLFDSLTNRVKHLGLSPNPNSRKIEELPKARDVNQCLSGKVPPSERIIEIDPVELEVMMKQKPDLLLLDVRELWEREIFSIKPSHHCPLGEFSSPGGPCLPDVFKPNREVVVYCKAGVRSRMACQALQALGYSKLYNLSGGTVLWADNIGL